jgi:hypothetical protein
MNEIERLAADAFTKTELINALLMQNMPTDYDTRKRAFINLAKARAAAVEADKKLKEAIDNYVSIDDNAIVTNR